MRASWEKAGIALLLAASLPAAFFGIAALAKARLVLPPPWLITTGCYR